MRIFDDSRAVAARHPYLFRLILAGLAVVVTGFPSPASAVPSYARQTGFSCEVCHTVFLELTPFGRDFKLNGYIFQTGREVTDVSPGKEKTLTLADLPPISFMVQVASNTTNKSVPDSVIAGANAQNTQLQFPQQASIFYAGKIAPHLGSFMQVTYDGAADALSMDNADIRFADTGTIGSTDVVYGLSLNNSPTVQDVYNTVPAWGFPFAGSSVAPAPDAATLIDGSLGQDVLGLTAYASFDKMFYVEGGAYRTARLGKGGPLDSTDAFVIDTLAPYWRFAYERRWGRNSWSGGTYGMYAAIKPGDGVPVTGGLSDHYTDVALDTQYQYIGDRDMISVFATWIHENAERDASFALDNATNLNDELQTFRATATYYYMRTIGGSVGMFSTWGDADPTVFGMSPFPGVSGSRTGKPNSNGAILELDYVPWLNTKLIAQYTIYNEFNGASKNYDGFGRDASDNNTLYFSLWYVF
ncbi:MAG: hypothetical protein WCF16_12645 [Alphaproteobacteria bacterium]